MDKIKRFEFRLSEEDYWLLRTLAAHDDKPVGELLRTWIHKVSKHKGITYVHGEDGPIEDDK